MQQSRECKTSRVLLGVLMGLSCAAAGAQTDASAQLERQSDEAFRQVLQQPQDLGLWSSYGRLLVQAGNYEGGIAALERLLLNPDAPPELRVEIAALYFRLGSYAMAESLLRIALADPRLQADQRAFADALLADVLKRNQRSQFSGVATIGLRHQSNPTYGTDSPLVLSGGVLAPLPSGQSRASDNDVNLGLRVQHAYDLDQQNSAAIASTFAAYVVDYRSSTGSQLQAAPTKPYDLLLLDFTTGLRFKPAPGKLPGLTLRPHLILTDLVAQRHQYLRNQGVGLDVSWQIDERTSLEVTLDAQDRTFANRIDITNADLLGGRLYGVRARVSRELGGGQYLSGEYAFRRNRTQRDFYDYDSHEARVTYSVAYASPMKTAGYWTTAVWLGALRRSYGAPDPTVTATQTREDREWRFGVSQTMPFSPVWSLVLSADQSRNNANLPNFRYKNTSLSGAVVRSF
jgi:tetratricopeptide (TPR) repeat protein